MIQCVLEWPGHWTEEDIAALWQVRISVSTHTLDKETMFLKPGY